MTKSEKPKRVRKDRSNILTLSERHVISEDHPFFEECAYLCHLSKNLYNATLYTQRQWFFAGSFKSYPVVNKLFTLENQPDYRALPAKVAKQIQMLVQQNFSSFFALLKKAKKGEYDKPVRLPRYLDKDGYQVIVYEKGALSFKEAGFIKLSQASIKIKTSISREQITNVRIVPKGNHFVIEVLYDVEKPIVDENDFSRVAFIDPGMNNLMTVTSNVFSPILYNGRTAKAINQLYNKDRAKIQSRLPFRKPAVDAPSYRQVNAVLKPYQTKTSKLLQGITKNRNYRIHDLFHKITTHLVNHLVENDVKVLIFGHNIGQKQDINLGSKTNQNFVSLPFTKLISMLQYKCERLGIQFIVTEESHTSKCSFLDLESIEHHDDYVGRRVKRGLFKSANGTCINADINGSLNIGRKYLTSVNQYSDQLHSELVAHMSNPRRLNIVLN